MSNQARSVEAFVAQKAEFDTHLAELAEASNNHFGADPDETLWEQVGWLNDANAKLHDLADQFAHRGEYARAAVPRSHSQNPPPQHEP
ncbi:hypothetical protein [Cyanobium sp. Morenito 9A2]|uniref:hypothetical protein n=1 Tax=Cyanobium sp. Morenito 9A2 TaxID=2823718 RepID=UPI0020CE85C5|nr:hypothetical protein [Cyanobium sp. Morenito 9A2]MCP9851044.1 hypothetical protein [Cyanobium sp. Morenito 9A2]